jgi:hypothetical protein
MLRRHIVPLDRARELFFTGLYQPVEAARLHLEASCDELPGGRKPAFREKMNLSTLCEHHHENVTRSEGVPMRDRIVTLSDKSGRSFNILISTPRTIGLDNIGRVIDRLYTQHKRTYPFQITGEKKAYGSTKETWGSWKALEPGFIRFTSGKILSKKTHEDLTTLNIYLINMDLTWGIQLFSYEDWTGVNEVGEGVIVQDWALHFDVGRLSWSLADWASFTH